MGQSRKNRAQKTRQAPQTCRTPQLPLILRSSDSPAFPPLQAEIVEAVAKGAQRAGHHADGRAASPLCFSQLPALMREGDRVDLATIALMRDKVRGLRDQASSAGALTSGNTPRKTDARLGIAREWHAQAALTIAPKRPGVLGHRANAHRAGSALSSVNRGPIASASGGHDFRPDYLRHRGPLRKSLERAAGRVHRDRPMPKSQGPNSSRAFDGVPQKASCAASTGA